MLLNRDELLQRLNGRFPECPFHVKEMHKDPEKDVSMNL